MKILITGSAGHLGEGLIRTLRKPDHQLLGIDILPSPFTDQVGTITDRAFVADCMKGVDVVLHTATLHKPHVVTHSKQDFLDVNVAGTLNLLEESVRHQVKAFIFTSTTSTFGYALRPQQGEPAVWVTEKLEPVPRNIYGASKIAAEQLCRLFFQEHDLPCLILRTSRFFTEEDDSHILRNAFSDLNIKANEYLHRRVDLQDVVDAHVLAMGAADSIGFGTYIISGDTPFGMEDLVLLNQDLPSVLGKYFPETQALYAAKGWELFPSIGRVYINQKAKDELGWHPKYDFQHVLKCLSSNQSFYSPLVQAVGRKGYHEEEFEDGPYPVNE